MPLVVLATAESPRPDPIAAAVARAHSVAAILAATADVKAVQRGLDASEHTERISVHGLPGGSLGVGHASPSAVTAATDPTTVAVPGGMSYLEPVPLARGAVAVVEVFVPEAELAAAAPEPSGSGAWWLLIGGWLLAVAALVIVTDRLARRVSRAARSIADAAWGLSGDGTTDRVAVTQPADIAEAAVAFNAMADRVAEQRAAERELIADLSHRLRTPLTALRLEAERAQVYPGDARLWQAVEGMEREVDRLINTARRNNPAPAPEPEQCDAAEVVRERMAFWAAVAEDQSRPYAVSGAERRAPVLLPRSDLAAALDALLGNVFRYTPQGTRFEVAVTRRDGMVAIRVDDAGPGIARPDRALRRGTSERGSTGLGLDIVRRAAVAGQGTVDVDRAAMGGASVVVLLADAEPPAKPVKQWRGFVGRLSREPEERARGRRTRHDKA